MSAASSIDHILGRLPEVEPGSGFDPIDTVAEIHLVAIEREDLPLRVALLDLDREDRFFDFSFGRLVVRQEQLSSELLRQRARAIHPALDDVFDERDDDTRNTEADVLVEGMIFGREDRLFKVRRYALVRNHLAAFDRELADDFAARAVDPRDRAWRIVVEGRDPGKISCVRENHPGRDSHGRGQQEERDDPSPASEAQVDLSSSAAWHCASDRPTRTRARFTTTRCPRRSPLP